jgi:hypothetical protein
VMTSCEGTGCLTDVSAVLKRVEGSRDTIGDDGGPCHRMGRSVRNKVDVWGILARKNNVGACLV